MSADNLPAVPAPAPAGGGDPAEMRADYAKYWREQNEAPPSGPVAAEIRAIERRMREDYSGYWQDAKAQTRYRQLLASEAGEELPATVEDAAAPLIPDDDDDEAPVIDHRHLDDADPSRAAGLRVVAEVRRELELSGAWPEFELAFDSLPKPVLTAIEADLTWGPVSFVTPATETELQRFASRPEQAELVRAWGPQHAGEKLARIRQRVTRIMDQLDDVSLDAALFWFDKLPAREAQSVLNALAKR